MRILKRVVVSIFMLALSGGTAWATDTYPPATVSLSYFNNFDNASDADDFYTASGFPNSYPPASQYAQSPDAVVENGLLKVLNARHLRSSKYGGITIPYVNTDWNGVDDWIMSGTVTPTSAGSGTAYGFFATGSVVTTGSDYVPTRSNPEGNNDSGFAAMFYSLANAGQKRIYIQDWGGDNVNSSASAYDLADAANNPVIGQNITDAWDTNNSPVQLVLSAHYHDSNLVDLTFAVYDASGSSLVQMAKTTVTDLNANTGTHFGLLSLKYNSTSSSWPSTDYAAYWDDFSLILRHDGDANGDGIVNLADLQILGDNWQASVATWAMADFTDDGTVNLADLQIIGDNWGYGTSSDLSFDEALAQVGITIPEPTSLVLLALPMVGGLLRTRRRSRQ